MSLAPVDFNKKIYTSPEMLEGIRDKDKPDQMEKLLGGGAAADFYKNNIKAKEYDHIERNQAVDRAKTGGKFIGLAAALFGLGGAGTIGGVSLSPMALLGLMGIGGVSAACPFIPLAILVIGLVIVGVAYYQGSRDLGDHAKVEGKDFAMTVLKGFSTGMMSGMAALAVASQVIPWISHTLGGVGSAVTLLGGGGFQGMAIASGHGIGQAIAEGLSAASLHLGSGLAFVGQSMFFNVDTPIPHGGGMTYLFAAVIGGGALLAAKYATSARSQNASILAKEDQRWQQNLQAQQTQQQLNQQKLNQNQLNMQANIT